MNQDKKIIVYLIGSLGLDGSSKIVLDLCVSFQDEYELHIITLKNNPELFSLSIVPAYVKVHQFNFEEDLDYSLTGYVRNLLLKKKWNRKYSSLIDLIIRINPVIIHCHAHPRDLMIINSARQLLGFGLLYTDHLTRIKQTEYSVFNRMALGWVFRQMYQNFHVVAVSESVFNYQQQFKIVSKKKLHLLVSNKVDTNFFVPMEKKRSDVIRVIYIARLHKVKGHDTLIKAWALLKSNFKCELILVGGGEEEVSLKKAVEKERCYYPVNFVGSSANILPNLQSAHIAVFPSLIEGLPLSLLEKMSCGLPVVVSNIPELTSIVRDLDNGLIFETGNAEQLAKKIELLIENPELRKSLGLKARQFVVDNFSAKESKKAYQDIYNKISNQG